MSDEVFRLLPESVPTDDIVDDPEFTEVTRNGEIYTLFRIVRVTHESVVRIRKPAIGVAHLRIIARVIEDAKVTLSAVQP
ncbi:MAG: hypothetical protein EBU67_02065 [Actinobacteria bacterium]|nr:hypothetical protein [Actinomycetota bacterium]